MHLKTALLLAVSIAAILPTTSFAQRYPVDIGEQHFDFELPNIDDGKPKKLSEYRGKKVLLIHFASW